MDFGGFAMPVWYEGIIAEHLTVRNAVGIFDTSHMGRVMAEGPDTERFLNRVITNDVSKLGPNEGLYTVMCTPDGGIIDTYEVRTPGLGTFTGATSQFTTTLQPVSSSRSWRMKAASKPSEADSSFAKTKLMNL